MTLTYRDEAVPPKGSLRHRDFQLFMKRFRKRIADRKVRFFMCGEYGDQGGRPHYHSIVFNYDFLDRESVARSGSGAVIYRSDLLSELWPHGFSSVGDVSFESAAYVARYSMKKVTGECADEHYDGRVPEYGRMSQGIGSGWYEAFKGDVRRTDSMVVRGFETRVARYYDKRFAKEDALALERIKEARRERAEMKAWDNTPERLRAKEAVAEARVRMLRREL